MRKPFIPTLLGCCLLLSSCGGKIPMVGFDKDGKSTEAFVNEKQYIQKMRDALLTIDESVVPALKRNQINQRGWNLRSAVLGFGVKVEGGIGPFKVGFKPGIHVAFGTGKNPPIP